MNKRFSESIILKWIVMKVKSSIGVTLSFVLFLGISLQASAQTPNCSKQRYCTPEEYGTYDYRSQTRSAILAPGDTVRTTVVVYSQQKTRVLLCAHESLGNVKFKLYDKVTEKKKFVKRVNEEEEEVEVFKKDGNGEVMKDDWGDPIIAGYETKINRDTIWGIRTVTRDVEVFDSSAGKEHWDNVAKQSKRLTIEAIIPEGDPDIEGCVVVHVGFKEIKEKRFKLE